MNRRNQNSREMTIGNNAVCHSKQPRLLNKKLPQMSGTHRTKFRPWKHEQDFYTKNKKILYPLTSILLHGCSYAKANISTSNKVYVLYQYP